MGSFGIDEPIYGMKSQAESCLKKTAIRISVWNQPDTQRELHRVRSGSVAIAGIVAQVVAHNPVTDAYQLRGLALSERCLLNQPAQVARVWIVVGGIRLLQGSQPLHRLL